MIYNEGNDDVVYEEDEEDVDVDDPPADVDNHPQSDARSRCQRQHAQLWDHDGGKIFKLNLH